VAIVGFAADQNDWHVVVRLVRLVEPVLLIAERWEACSNALEQGLHAASQVGDTVAQAYFAHQQGTLAAAQQNLEDAGRLLEKALELRQRVGDEAGADVTRANMAVLGLVSAPPPPQGPFPGQRPRRRRGPVAAAAAGALALLVLLVLAVNAFGGSSGTTTASRTTSASGTTTPTGTTSASGTTSPTGTTSASGTTSPTGTTSASGTASSGGATTTSAGPKQTRPASPSPARVVFDPVNITPGSGSSSQSVTVTNHNEHSITINSIRTTDSQFSVPAGCRGELAAAASCTVAISFQPTSLGQQQGQLIVETAGTQATSVSLLGTGYVELIVTVDKGDNGTGTVTGGTGLISCPSKCQVIVQQPDQAHVTLEAIADSSGTDHSVFRGWRGDCSGTSATCDLSLTRDRQVDALFDFVVG
jgi:hypothetical protein